MAGLIVTWRPLAQTATLRLNGGQHIRIATGCTGAMQVGQRVVVSGRAHFRANGLLHHVVADLVTPASEIDLEVWSQLPEPLFHDAPLSRVWRAQTPTTGINAIFGRWPGDESDEEVFRLLDEIS